MIRCGSELLKLDSLTAATFPYLLFSHFFVQYEKMSFMSAHCQVFEEKNITKKTKFQTIKLLFFDSSCSDNSDSRHVKLKLLSAHCQVFEEKNITKKTKFQTIKLLFFDSSCSDNSDSRHVKLKLLIRA